MKWLWIALGIGAVIMATKKTVDTVLDSVVERLALAIQRAEGFYEGSWSWETNNPGNITDQGRPGQIGSRTNPLSGITFPVFDSYESGFAALVWKIRRAFTGESSMYSADMTFEQFFEIWSGDINEARNVAAELGVSIKSTLRSLLQ